MPKITPLKTFNVTARLVVIATIEVRAEDLADANTCARTLDTDDFITFKDEHVDSSCEIIGISQDKKWDVRS